ncbi:hypothetical protein AB3S75_044143 [Citrus x aurantiifolia]
MAGAHFASVNLPASLTNATTTPPESLKSPHSSSNFTALSPRRLTKRKNYLRPKILKTPTKPRRIEPVIIIAPQPENDAGYSEEPSVNEIEEIAPLVDDVKEIQVLETQGLARENSGIFGEEDSEEKSKNKNANGFSKGVSVNGGSKGSISTEKNMSFMDKTVEDKINEIRAMAREAREIEERRLRNGDDEGGSDDESVSSQGRIGIENEIGARLDQVEKKYNSRNGKSPGLSIDVLDEFEDDEEEGKDSNKTLMFKKKLRFRGPSMSLTSDAKGFSSLGSREANVNRKNDRAGSNSDLRASSSGENSNFLQNDGKSLEKMPKKMGVGDNSDTGFGTVQETSQGSVEGVRPRKSKLKMQNSQNFTKESQESTAESKKDGMLERNGGLQQGALQDKPTADITRDNKSAAKSDFWWSNLPYVLAIVMRRGFEQEGAEGLFALRTASEVQDQDNASYTVVFENHVDANHFCHLLESFFEDLGDFSTDIIPLPVKELLAAVKSNTKKVIVLKKGQLKLYAGQPFADVEKALLSLVEHNYGASTRNLT